MFDKLLPQMWMLVPPAERLVLAASFRLSKSGIVEIRDQEVLTDGYKPEDLERINRETMAEWVGEPADTELTFSRLWELSVMKAHSIVHPPSVMMTSEDGVASLEEPPAPIDLSQLKEVSNEEFAATTKPKPSKNAKATKGK